MSNTERVLDLLGMKMNRAQLNAARYLERQGQRFCVDFGIQNAIDNARAHWRARRNRKRKQ